MNLLCHILHQKLTFALRLYLTWIGIFVYFNFLNPVSAFSQQIVGTYTASSGESGLFFVNPGYFNPARGCGVLGMQGNPAALGAVEGRELAFAGILPQRTSSQFTLQTNQSTEIYKALDLNAEFSLKEQGGLAGIGFALQHKSWRFGGAILQPRLASLAFKMSGSTVINSDFQVDRSITREMAPDLPVEEIPIKWQVNTQIRLSLTGKPAKIELGVLPISLGVGFRKGVLSLGGGLTYYHIYSNDETSSFKTSLTGSSQITGTPYGNDPLTGQPWRGILTADCTVQDEPLKGYYNFKISGGRFALNFGGMLNLPLLSLGASYAYGFKSSVTGNYNIKTVFTSGLPELRNLSLVDIDWSLRPEVKGTATLKLDNFQKDSLSYENHGSLKLNGYQSISAGVHILCLGLFAGGEIPVSPPDMSSITLGAYLDFPVPKTPVRFNVGFIQRTDGVWGMDRSFIPYRVLAHTGAGVAVRLPFYKWLNIGDRSGWFRFGLRSSLTSLTLNAFKKQASDTHNEALPSLTESLGLSIGFELPL